MCPVKKKSNSGCGVYTIKKIGFIKLDEANKELATYTYNYAAINNELKQPVPAAPEQHKKHLIRSGIKVFMPCFLFFLFGKRFRLSAKEKLKKKLRILKRLKLRHQRFKELIREIEEAALLRMNLNKEALDVASKEFKKWLKKLQTPFYSQ